MVSVIPMPYENTVIKITSNDYEVVDSGIVFFFKNDYPMELKKRFNNGALVNIRIIVKDDETERQDLLVNVNQDESVVEYTCINFNNAFGTGTNEPVEVATIDDKKYFLHFWIYTLGDNENRVRKMEYTVWKEK
ncbi:MAG: hypothetical protein IJH64_14440 [Oscillospiraceae bacterium]|nr:hypothetical protein [Oscillospiraceae bacterium]